MVVTAALTVASYICLADCLLNCHKNCRYEIVRECRVWTPLPSQMNGMFFCWYWYTAEVLHDAFLETAFELYTFIYIFLFVFFLETACLQALYFYLYLLVRVLLRNCLQALYFYLYLLVHVLVRNCLQALYFHLHVDAGSCFKSALLAASMKCSLSPCSMNTGNLIRHS